MNPRTVRSAPLLGLTLASAIVFPAFLSGCGDKAETGTAAPSPVVQAVEDSDKAAEAHARSQQKK